MHKPDRFLRHWDTAIDRLFRSRLEPLEMLLRLVLLPIVFPVNWLVNLVDSRE